MALKGKVAIVTGAGRGIGKAIALRLARDGAAVAVNDISGAGIAEVVKEIKSFGGKAIDIVADVSRGDQVAAMTDKVVAQFGKLDIMVANAGIITIKPAIEITESEWDKVMAVNARGVFLCAQAGAKQMIKQGNGGKIINCASIAGHQGFPFEAHYCASKFAVIGFSQAFAKEVAKNGITVNCYCPGVVATDMWEDIDLSLSKYNGLKKGESIQKFIDQIPLGRVQTPEDVAGLVAYLASPDANYMTGQAINICGGLVMD